MSIAFKLPDLPYNKDDLEPHISSDTLNYHHGKHHQAYITKCNKILENNTEFDAPDLIDVMKKSFNINPSLFNNAAQAWNHEFYWKCMKPGSNKPPERLMNMISQSFGSLEKCIEEFQGKAANNFGSGWTWLVQNQSGVLEIVNSQNAGNPILDNKTPLLTIDVWEHAYYLDYQNARPNYLATFFEHLVNWEFASQQLK